MSNILTLDSIQGKEDKYMHPYFIYLLLRTVPHGEEKVFEDKKLEIKPRAEWLSKAIYEFLGTIVSLVVFLLLSKFPYVGPVFFLLGLMGFFYSIVSCIRDILIYIYYEDLFTEENIKKLENR